MMLFSLRLLQRKGLLGVVWIAAHLDKRLKRRQVFEVSIPDSVDVILNSDTPLALRHSGQLLFGLVRLYARKCTYILEECNSGLAVIQRVAHQEMLVNEAQNKDEEIFVVPANCFETMTQDIEEFCRGRPNSGPGVDLHLDDDSYVAKKSSNMLSFSDTVETAFPMMAEEAPPFPDNIVFDFEKDAGPLQPTSGADGMEIDAPRPADTPKSVEPEFHAQPMPGDFGGMDVNNDGMEMISPAGDFDVFMPDMNFESPGTNLDPVGTLGSGYGHTGVPGSPGMSFHGTDPPPSEQHHEAEDRMEAVSPLDEPGPSSVKQASQSPNQSASIPLPEEDVATGAEKDVEVQDTTKSRSRSNSQAKKRRRLLIIDALDGRPADQLTGHSIRALLEDPSPLMVKRGPDVQPAKKQKLSNMPMMDQEILPHAVSLDHAPTLKKWYLKQCVQKQKPVPVTGEERVSNPIMEQQDPEPEEVPSKGPEDAPVPASEGQEVNKSADIALPDFPEPDLFDTRMDAPVFDAPFDGPMGGDGIDGSYADIPFPEPDADLFPDVPSTSPQKTTSAPVLGEQEAEEETGATSRDDFTSRTQVVLSHVESSFAKSTMENGSIKMDSLLAKKKKLDASRWFFECLVLQSRGHVNMEQREAYGHILISSSTTNPV